MVMASMKAVTYDIVKMRTHSNIVLYVPDANEVLTFRKAILLRVW